MTDNVINITGSFSIGGATNNQPIFSTQTVNGPPYGNPHHGFGLNTFIGYVNATDHNIETLNVQQYFGTSSFRGGSEAIHVENNLVSPTSPTLPDRIRFYTGITTSIRANVDDNGVSGTPRGLFYGILGAAGNADAAGSGPGAVYPRALVGAQIGVFTYPKTFPFIRVAVEAVDNESSTQGQHYDAAFSVTSNAPAVGWRTGLLFAPTSDRTFDYNYNPMSPTGTLIATDHHNSFTVKAGIDWGSWTFTGSEYDSKNVGIDGSTGNVAVKRGGLSVGAISPAADTQRAVQINGAATGTGAGTFVVGYGAANPVWAIGNSSSLLGGAYDPTLLMWSPTAAYRFNGLTAGLLTSSANGTVSVTGSTGSGNVVLATSPTLHPGTSVTPANNGDLVIEATSNTTLTFKLKGSDGVVRSGTITLS